jgi:hypothetical protein
MYISKLLNVSMDHVINWYLLLIIFVFDPLAITLVVIANQAFNKTRIKTTEKEANEPPKEIIVEKIVEVPIEVEKIVEVPVMQEATNTLQDSAVTGSHPDIYQEKNNKPNRPKPYWT